MYHVNHFADRINRGMTVSNERGNLSHPLQKQSIPSHATPQPVLSVVTTTHMSNNDHTMLTSHMSQQETVTLLFVETVILTSIPIPWRESIRDGVVTHEESLGKR